MLVKSSYLARVWDPTRNGQYGGNTPQNGKHVKVRQVFRPQLFIATMQVTDEEVDAFFAKLPPGQELELEQPQPRL